MKILLIGEYSNLHWTIAKGLRQLGYDVTVASDGCSWMQNSRDINISLQSLSLYHRIKYRFDILKSLTQFKGYDIVQFISPSFLRLNPTDLLRIFAYLKCHNGKLFLGAFGTDYYYTKGALEGIYRYSDFKIPNGDGSFRSVDPNLQWMDKPLMHLNTQMAEQCNGIIACLYEYYHAYKGDFADKLAYAPLPIDTTEITPTATYNGKARFFVGVQRSKRILKGCDIMLDALNGVAANYPDRVDVQVVESLPYSEYIECLTQSNILVDQLYSYTPAMNALLGMARGMVTVSGGEPEMYNLIGESKNHPIVNMQPTMHSAIEEFTKLVESIDTLPQRGADSRKFVEQHHNYIDVAKRYIDIWRR